MWPGVSTRVPDDDPEWCSIKDPHAKVRGCVTCQLGYQIMISSVCSTKDPHAELSCRVAWGLN